MEGLNKNPQERNYDDFLKELWYEYGFSGHPPFAESVAEKRLKDTCDKYANFIDKHKNDIVGNQFVIYGTKKISSSDSLRRELHNQIAIMVSGRQRSGMGLEQANQIAEFAYEYSRGYKIGEAGKYIKN